MSPKLIAPKIALVVFGLATIGGCTLGWVEEEPGTGHDLVSQLQFRIENATASDAEITIVVNQPEAVEDENPEAAQASQNEGDASVAAAESEGESPKTNTSASQVQEADSETKVKLGSGGVSTGSLECTDQVTISATVGESTTSVRFSGAGTGTPGFDSGSIGLTGERFLVVDADYECGDTVLIRLEAADRGNLLVVPSGEPLPDPITSTPPDDVVDDPVQDSQTVVAFRLENATRTAADIKISSGPEVASDSEGEEGAETSQVVLAEVRTPAGEFTTGEIACGDTFVISATMADEDFSAVLFTGEGTGTAGFDSSSVGFGGERLLLFGEHYACGETIAIRIEDDGSGIGLSTSNQPEGRVNVFASSDALPDPDLPDPDAPTDPQEVQVVNVVVVNDTESTIQINLASGNGTLASSGGADVSSELDVRVLPGTSSTGTVDCAQEFVIAAAHLEPLDSTLSEPSGGSIFEGSGNVNYHGVVLTGDGTGTAGFDDNSISVIRGRLFLLDEHFNCGDTITITVTATNNKTKMTEEGEVEVDEYGNPMLDYGVGSGTIAVTTEEPAP